MNAIVIVIDRLHVGHLGAYGNSWVQTPAIDRLASEGFVFDQAILESPELDRLYASYWLGRHALCPPLENDAGLNLPALLADCSIPATLLTDDRTIAESQLASGFREIIALDFPDADRSAAAVEQTRLGQCFAELVELAESSAGPHLAWCHFRGLSAAWDAPREFRIAHHEDGDPEPPEGVGVPSTMLPEDYDPDELLGYHQAYAAQVSLLDACVAVLLEALAEIPVERSPLVAITSARGFPLGEHRRVGVCDEALYSELVHVPLLMRFPDRLGAADRSQALVQPADLWRTLLDWYGLEPSPAPHARNLIPVIRGDVESVRDRALIVGRGDERAIVTPAWYLRRAGSAELFLRPDDRWEASDVLDRCPDVTEALLNVLAQDEQLVQNRQATDFEPLDPQLRFSPE